MSKLKLNLDQFEAVIFDMDGTMVDNTKFHEKSVVQFLQARGIKLGAGEFKKRFFGKKNDAALKDIFGDKFSKQEISNLADEREALYRKMYAPFIKEVQGLTELIKKIKAKGLKVAIATTAPKVNRKFVLDALNLHGNFEVIIGEEHVKKGKPDPEIYLKAAKALKVDPKDSLVFEDSRVGVKAAKNAGMTVVALLTTHKKEELKEADFEVEHFEQVEII